MTRRSRHVRGEGEELDRFIDRCRAALATAYAAACAKEPNEDIAHAQSIRLVLRMLAVMLAGARIPSERTPARSIGSAASAVVEGSAGAFDESCRAARDESGIGILDPGHSPADHSFAKAARSLLYPPDNSVIDPLFFQAMPVWWIGCAYQAMLALRPSSEPGVLRADRSRRKGRGIYFTPPCLVNYIVKTVIGPIAENRLGPLVAEGAPDIAVLDPSMGGGDFLGAVVELISEAEPGRRREAAAECVYGVDIDPIAVEIARFAVWAASGFADGISDSLDSHLIHGDALSSDFPSSAFDAVIGNPPYVASKNGLRLECGASAPLSTRQSDTYLLFLAAVMERGLVRPGGMLSMVLPDPMLVRENAAPLRCRLTGEWTIVSLLHIFGAFPDTEVANVVPVFRDSPPTAETFTVARIERTADLHGFVLEPVKVAAGLARPVRRETVLAQKRCEWMYLLEEGSFAGIVRRIHGPSLALSNYQPPFAPLRALNVRAIYRGEEIGKSAITDEDQGLPMLLGGQSVQPFEIVWEGRRILPARVRKPLDRYQRTKVLIQKSSARVIAAVDDVRGRHKGYLFPQSVYAVELKPDGISPLYLLCLLNSELMREYIRRTVTAYKMVQPQLEIEDLKGLPIRRIRFITRPGRRGADLERGVGLFHDECLRSGENMHFPELANFAGVCLTANPERSDVVHDILVHLGRLAVGLTRKNRGSPDADVTHQLECVRSAIEAIVWRLYSSEPAQMALAI